MVLSSHLLVLTVLLLLTATAIGVFWIYPHIDLTVSSWFYDAGHVHRFPLMYDPLLRFIQKGMYWVVYGTTALLLALCLYRVVTHCPVGTRLTAALPGCQRRAGFLLLALALGPGIMAQLMTKEVFNRPRPVSVQQFGGQHQFIPPAIIGDEEGKSFVSGHAAMGFYFTAFALVASSWRWRIGLYVLGIAFGLFLGGCRVIQGRHFVSDVLFSGLFSLMIIHLSCLITSGVTAARARLRPAQI